MSWQTEKDVPPEVLAQWNRQDGIFAERCKLATGGTGSFFALEADAKLATADPADQKFVRAELERLAALTK